MPRKGFPRLAMSAEIREILGGVSRQEAYRIATTNPRFPDPVATLAAGAIYLWDEVVEFAAIERKLGRPPSPK